MPNKPVAGQPFRVLPRVLRQGAVREGEQADQEAEAANRRVDKADITANAIRLRDASAPNRSSKNLESEVLQPVLRSPGQKEIR